MKPRTRTFLFLASIILFFLLAPLAIFYSKGYRIDFGQRRIVKTGGFYLKASPKSAEIFIDKNFKKKTDFFFGAAFLENFLPKEYIVELKKTGYQAWKKTLNLESGRVTEAKNIFLVPENLSFELITSRVKRFWPSPDGEKIILEEQVLVQEKESWELKLYDVKNNIKAHLIGEKELLEEESVLSDLVWSLDSERLLIETGGENRNYFLLETEKIPSSPVALDFLKDFEALYLHPTNSDEIFFTNNQESGLLTILKAEADGETVKKILDEVVVFGIDKRNIYWLDQKGFLNKSDFEGRSQNLALTTLPLAENANYQIIILDSEIFLLSALVKSGQEEKRLFYFDRDFNIFKEVALDVDFLSLSPNSERLCFWNDSEVWVWFLEEKTSQPAKEIWAKTFLTRISEKIEDFYWWNNYYLIFKSQSEIKIIETDDRDQIQIWDLVRFKDPEIYFNQKDKKLYVLSEGDFFASQSF